MEVLPIPRDPPEANEVNRRSTKQAEDKAFHKILQNQRKRTSRSDEEALAGAATVQTPASTHPTPVEPTPTQPAASTPAIAAGSAEVPAQIQIQAQIVAAPLADDAALVQAVPVNLPVFEDALQMAVTQAVETADTSAILATSMSETPSPEAQTASQTSDTADAEAIPAAQTTATQTQKSAAETVSTQKFQVPSQEAARKETQDQPTAETNQTLGAQAATLEARFAPQARISAETVPHFTDFSADLAQQITRNMQAAMQQQQSSLRVRLNPQELGAIDIRLVSTQSGVSVTVLADQTTTGKLLESQLEQLRATLTQAGVQLSQLNVGQNGQSFTPQEWFARQQQAQWGRTNGSPRNANGSEETIASTPATSLRLSAVDYRI